MIRACPFLELYHIASPVLRVRASALCIVDPGLYDAVDELEPSVRQQLLGVHKELLSVTNPNAHWAKPY